MIDVGECEAVARSVAAAYKRRRCRVPFDELVQEAWLGIMLASRSFDQSRGVPFPAYAWHAATRWLSGFVWRDSSPVYASLHNRKQLRGLRAVEVGERDLGLDSSPEQLLLADERRAMLFAVAAQVLAPLGHDSGPALLVLAGLTTPREWAATAGRPRRELYLVMTQARTLLAGSAEFWQAYQTWRSYAKQ